MKKINLLLSVLFFLPGFVFSQLSWEVSTAVSPVSSYRGGTAYHFDGSQHKQYVFGGWGTSSGNFNETSIYNISDDTWTSGPIIPENTKGGSALGIGDDIYLLIGNNGDDVNVNSKIFLRYNVPSDSWDYMAEYPVAARYVSLAYNPVNGFIYGAGGSGENYAAVQNVCAYDVLNNTWTDCNTLPYPSSGGSALIYEGHHLYLVGGLINEPNDKLFKGLIDMEDPFSITWNYCSSIPMEMAKLSAGYIGNGKILASELNGTFAYDISTDMWEMVENKPIPVKGGNYLSVNVDNAFKFIVAGGRDANDNYVDHVEYVQAETNLLFPATFVLTMNSGEPAVNAIIEVAGYSLQTDEAGAAVQYLENGTYEYTASFDDLIAMGTFTIESQSMYVENELVVSVNEIKDEFSIYPNPANGIFILEGAANSLIEVCDIKGNLIYSKSDIENNFAVDISTNGPGLYFVKILHYDGSISMRKIILE